MAGWKGQEEDKKESSTPSPHPSLFFGHCGLTDAQVCSWTVKIQTREQTDHAPHMPAPVHRNEPRGARPPPTPLPPPLSDTCVKTVWSECISCVARCVVIGGRPALISLIILSLDYRFIWQEPGAFINIEAAIKLCCCKYAGLAKRLICSCGPRRAPGVTLGFFGDC